MSMSMMNLDYCMRQAPRGECAAWTTTWTTKIYVWSYPPIYAAEMYHYESWARRSGLEPRPSLKLSNVSLDTMTTDQTSLEQVRDRHSQRPGISGRGRRTEQRREQRRARARRARVS